MWPAVAPHSASIHRRGHGDTQHQRIEHIPASRCVSNSLTVVPPSLSFRLKTSEELLDSGVCTSTNMEQQPLQPQQGDLNWRLSAHPITLLFFLGFRISALLMYLFGVLFIKNLYVLENSGSDLLLYNSRRSHGNRRYCLMGHANNCPSLSD